MLVALVKWMAAHLQATLSCAEYLAIHITALHLFPSADTRYSAMGFVAWLVLFLPWVLVFSVGGPGLVGADLYAKLDVTQINIAELGLGS